MYLRCRGRDQSRERDRVSEPDNYVSITNEGYSDENVLGELAYIPVCDANSDA